MGRCCACGRTVSFNPLRVPSLVVNGRREPLCRFCFHRWNEIHRISKGLKPEPLAPDAYQPIDEAELP
jgi:hypothetical protein